MTGYNSDTMAMDLIAKLSIDPNAVPHFTLNGGVLRYNNRIWIGNNTSIETVSGMSF